MSRNYGELPSSTETRAAVTTRLYTVARRARLPELTGRGYAFLSRRRRGVRNWVALRFVAGHPALAWIARQVTWLAELGTQGYAPDVRRRLMILNLIAYLIVITTIGYTFQHISLDYATYRPVILINLALIVAAALVPLAHRIHEIAGGLLIVIAEWIALLAFTMYMGTSSGVHLQYFVGAAACFVVLGLERIKLTLVLVVSGLVLHLVAWFQFPPSAARIAMPQDMLDSFYVQAAVTTVALTAASVWYAFRLAEQARAETDALLRNILPDSVADRLKAKPGEIVADSHDEVSVLFADISGFVALARSLGAARVVEMLNQMVSEFDGLAARHGVEKIKTIGDAYMAVAGLPEPAADHACRLTGMALDMLATVERIRETTGLQLRMRVGIASGPVMAGVIGTKKFSYDVWGDPVNLAARLEGLSSPGRILVCPNCRQRLVGVFDLEARGAIEIKGVGQQETFFVLGPTNRAQVRQVEIA